MKIYKKLKPFISLVCAVLLIFSTISFSVAAVSTNSVTAATGATVKQGYSYTCYVDIGSTENLAALDVTVHFDPAKVKITNVYNSINCTLYDSVINTDNIQFSYILDGKGSASKTRLFYFNYQVLNNADLGNSYFDITIGEAYDNSLNDVSVSGSRCNFTITETVTNKSCSVYSSSPVSASVEKEFTLNYRFSTYQIASGTAVITYDPELFEVVKVTNGEFLTNKIVDVNTELSGEIYISFVGTEYYSDANLVAVTFKPIKNVTETSKIYFKAVELIDKELNSISCSGYTTNVNVAFDNTYTGDAPAMKLDGSFSYEDKQITLVVSLEKDSRLGAGDFVIAFDPELVSYNSCTKGFTPSFFNINDKKVENGELKFHIISLSDITTEETVLTVVFDVKCPYGCATADFTLNGTGLTDSLTESIMLNFIDESVWLEYQVKFLDADGTLLQSGIYHYGDIIAEPVAPTKESDVYGKYTFSGWDKEVTPCAADTVYTATYTLEYTDYTVIFKNWDDTEISRATYHYGDVVAVPETPAKEKDSYYIYNFVGWDKEVANCSGNAEYKAVFSAEHYHTYEKTVTAPDCTNQGFTTNTCACGDTYKDNYVAELGHDYKWVTDKAENCGITGLKHEKCSRCDSVRNENTVIPATGKHSYTSKVTTEPSCTVDGVETFTCTVCSDTYTKAISANGHTPADAVIENRVEPKCEIKGSYDEVVYCSVCTAEISRVKKSIDATGHSYTSQVISPNCTDKGYTLNTCSSCGDTYKSDYVDEFGHNYKWVTDKAENCGVTGLKHEKCSRCDSVRNENTVIPATGEHSYTSKVTTEPSCTVDGVETFTCSVCSDTYTKAISANGHTPADAVIENRVEPKCEIKGSYDEVVYCSVCTAEISRVKKSIDATGHSYTSQVISPNCTDKGYTLNTCSSCGNTYKSDYIDELGHDYKWVIDKAENCGVTGLKHEKCNRCDSVRNENTVIPATGKHSYTSKVTTEPSCTVDGVETFTCSVCSDTYTKAISANGHTPADAVIENRVEPKCEIKGSYDEVVYCSVCTAEISREKKSIDATGHSYTSQVISPNCTDKGYTLNTCSSCGDTYKSDYVDEFGHNYKWVTDKAENCGITGLKHEKCSRCDSVRNENTVIPATGKHSYTSKVTTEPSCTVDGVETFTCSVCSDTYTKAISANGYTPADAVIENRVEPKCEIKGSYDEVVYCSVCTAEISRVKKSIDATGHSYTSQVISPNCTDKGYTLNTCSSCGNTYKSDYIDELGHDYKWVIDKAENCGVTGLKHEKCNRCDAVRNENTVIPATGEHSYTSKVTTEPSCTVDGVETFTCSVCSDTYTKAISANGDTPADAVIENRVEPKCEIKGSYDEVVYCSVCTAEISRVKKSIDATGHSYTSQVISPNCTDKGYTLNTCSSCGNTYKSDYIDELGHDYKWVIDKAENCGVTGLKHEKCNRCDAVRNENTVIPATGEHSYTSKVTTEPSCTVDGVETFTCSVCSDTFTKAISAAGHSYVDHEARVPDCTQIGWNAYQTCENCDYTTYLELPATDHANKTEHAQQDSTCTEIGYTAGVYCPDCKKWLSGHGEIPELPHAYETVTVPASFTDDGMTQSECSCGDVEFSISIPKLSSVKLSTASCTYNGKTRSPSVSVTDSAGNALVNGTDYDVTIPSGRKNPGVYEYKISFKGNYEGEKTLTFTILPKAPAKISATQSTSVIKLSWSESVGATGYRVYQYSPSKGKYVQIASVKGVTSYRKATNLKPGTEYSFKIKPYTKLSDGTVLWGTASEAFTTATECKAPAITSVTSASKSKATVKWSDVSGETGYQLYYSTSKNGTYKKVNSYAADKLAGSKTFSSSSSGKTIYFKVRAYKKVAGQTIFSEWSAVKSVKLK